ncbi:MAG: heme exporter protein CcmD [Alphaproteobacteria bacterium]
MPLSDYVTAAYAAAFLILAWLIGATLWRARAVKRRLSDGR